MLRYCCLWEVKWCGAWRRTDTSLATLTLLRELEHDREHATSHPSAYATPCQDLAVLMKRAGRIVKTEVDAKHPLTKTLAALFTTKKHKNTRNLRSNKTWSRIDVVSESLCGMSSSL